MVPNNLFWIASKACHHFAKHLPLNFNEWRQVGLWVGKQGRGVSESVTTQPPWEGRGSGWERLGWFRTVATEGKSGTERASWQDSGVFQGTCGHSDCKFVSLIANFPPSFGGPSIHAGWMRAANPQLMEIITRGKREESRTKIRKDVSSYKELQRWKKKSEHGRAWVLVLTLILCHGKKSHTSPDGRRWEPTAKVPCHLPPGLEPETANLLVMFPRKSMNLLLTCVLSEWFIDFFSISKWLILLFFFKCQN